MVVSCLVLHPYLAILGWLLMRGLFWVAQVLLAPLLMGAVLAALTLWLARQEFRTQLPGRRISAALTDLCSSFPTIPGPLLALLLDLTEMSSRGSG